MPPASFAIPLRSFRFKKREFNRKDAKNCKVRKVQFHAVYSIAQIVLSVSIRATLLPAFCKKFLIRPFCLVDFGNDSSF